MEGRRCMLQGEHHKKFIKNKIFFNSVLGGYLSCIRYLNLSCFLSPHFNKADAFLVVFDCKRYSLLLLLNWLTGVVHESWCQIYQIKFSEQFYFYKLYFYCYALSRQYLLSCNNFCPWWVRMDCGHDNCWDFSSVQLWRWKSAMSAQPTASHRGSHTL